MVKRWQIGSEFDWCSDFVMASDFQTFLPEKYALFSTGTATLFALEKLINQKPEKRLRLHLPSFLCMHFAAKLKSIFEVHWYRDLPTQESPDFNSINPLPGDLVLAVNLFGIRQGDIWQNWLMGHEDIILIEDHSHDPFSPWARQSKAHYAMASLRKTLPVPDGGMIWSPRNLQLPKPFNCKSSGAEKRLTAMLLKQAYLRGADISKDVYRQLELEGDEDLDKENNCAVSSFTAHILPCLKIGEFRQRREANVRQFLNWISAEQHQNWKPLFNSWNSGCVPFNSVIVCQTQDIRDALRKYLISHNIFPPIHWQQNPLETSSNDALAIELSHRILTIPTDQRYSLDDIARVATKMTEFLQSYHKNIPHCLI